MTRRRDAAASQELEWLLAMARRLAGSLDGDDIAQDAWLSVDGSQSRSQPWQYGVVRNRWRMRVRSETRRRLREREVGAITTDRQEDDPERVAMRRHVARTLRELLGELEPVDREIVVLRHCEGWSAPEISRELELPAATVRTRLRRALQALRRGLDERWGAEAGRWQLAVAPAVGLPQSTGTAVVAWIPLAAGAALLVALVGALAWSGRRDTEQVDRPQVAAKSLASESQSPDPRAEWSSTLDALQRARARRFAALSVAEDRPDAVDTAADGLRALFFAEAGAEAKPLLRVLGKQVSETLKECARMHPSPSGSITARARVIGEPDIGVVVESVDITKDTVGDTELRECVQESAYTYAFPDSTVSLYVAHDFTVDMDARQVSAGAVLPLTQLPDVLERYPEFVDALPGVLEQVPGIRVPMQKLIDADPTIADRLPRFVDLVADSAEPADP